jgi:hypothetical protein
MSLVLGLGLPIPKGELARGRRRVCDDPVQRRRHIRCAYHRLIADRSPRWIASRCRVSIRTVNLWVQAALGYSDPEAVALRRHLAETSDR